MAGSFRIVRDTEHFQSKYSMLTSGMHNQRFKTEEEADRFLETFFYESHKDLKVTSPEYYDIRLQLFKKMFEIRSTY